MRMPVLSAIAFEQNGPCFSSPLSFMLSWWREDANVKKWRLSDFDVWQLMLRYAFNVYSLWLMVISYKKNSLW